MRLVDNAFELLTALSLFSDLLLEVNDLCGEGLVNLNLSLVHISHLLQLSLKLLCVVLLRVAVSVGSLLQKQVFGAKLVHLCLPVCDFSEVLLALVLKHLHELFNVCVRLNLWLGELLGSSWLLLNLLLLLLFFLLLLLLGGLGFLWLWRWLRSDIFGDWQYLLGLLLWFVHLNDFLIILLSSLLLAHKISLRLVVLLGAHSGLGAGLLASTCSSSESASGLLWLLLSENIIHRVVR